MSSPAITREHTPVSCCNSRKSIRLPAHWKMRPDSPALCAEQFLVPNQRGKEPWFAWRNYIGVLTSLNKQKCLMSSPAVTLDRTPASRCNSRKIIRVPARWKMRPDSPVLRAEQFLFPNQRGKEPWFDWRKYRESPRSLRSLEEHWCHGRNVKYLSVAQINSRLSPIPLHWLQNNSLFPVIHDKWLDFL